MTATDEMISLLRQNAVWWIQHHPVELDRARDATATPAGRHYARQLAFHARDKARRCREAASILEKGGTVLQAQRVAINATMVMVW